MARKGVLISDESVNRMTDFQWYFEAEALRRKEKQHADNVGEVFKHGVRMLRRLGVGLLGLNIIEFAGTDPDADDAPFIPLSLLAGTPELLQHAQEMQQDEAKVANALDDDGFEAISAALARGENPFDQGDMAPIVVPTPQAEDEAEPEPEPELIPIQAGMPYMQSEEYQEALAAFVMITESED